MSVIPSAWTQAYPRAVRLAPDGTLVPAATLRTLLRHHALELLVSGFALEPWIRDGDRVRVEAGAAPRRGDVALCESGGWGDLRRVVLPTPEGGAITGLDVVPGPREHLPAARILGLVTAARGCGDAPGRLIARAFPIASRFAALLYWRRRILEAPSFGADAPRSVQAKYGDQVEAYSDMIDRVPDEEALRTLAARLTPSASVLVAGSGAGSEMIYLAKQGFRVTGFDFVPGMVQAARRNAAAARVEAEVLAADMVSLDLGGRRFRAVYVTPLVYSFIAGRERRIEALRRLGRHLEPGGPVLFSAHLLRRPAQRLSVLAVWLRDRRRGAGAEFGDWYTWFLTPRGAIGKSFLHFTRPGEVRKEARAAGFGRVEPAGPAQFIASGFRDRA